MGIEKKVRHGMPPRGDVLRKEVAEAVANIDYKTALQEYAKTHGRIISSSGLPPVHLDPPYRSEEYR